MRLKAKLTLGVIAIAIFIMISTIAVVYGVLDKQNRQSINISLTKTLDIARNDLLKRRDKIDKATLQTIKVEKVGSNLDYLTGYGKSLELSALKTTYDNIANAIRQILVANNLGQSVLYDVDGVLQAYARRGSDQKVQVGYSHVDQDQRKNIHFTETGEETPLNESEWSSSGRLPLDDLEETLNTKPSQSAASAIVSRKGKLYLKCATPIMANRYNPQTDTLEPVLTGAIISYQNLGTRFVQELAELTGADLNLYLSSGTLSAGTLAAHTDLKSEPIRTDTAALDLIGETPQFDTVNQDQGGYLQAALPLINEGQPSGWITALMPERIVKANTNQMIGLLGIVYIVSLVIVLPAAYLFAGTFAGVVNRVVGGLKDIAEGEGDLTRRLSIKNRDEIGDLVYWFNIFIEKLHTLVMDIAEMADNLQTSSGELAEASMRMDKGAQEISKQSQTVAKASDEMKGNINTIAVAMEQSSVNLSTVSSAAEEMTATISEIARNTAGANVVTLRAVEQSRSTTIRVNELGEAAKRIGKVTETITEISEQTNLLALNATIEAARAGEAGKGFVVVANEIKELARQTASATAEIKEQIGGIQHSSKGTIDEIEKIAGVIDEVSAIVSTISTAVEEQSSTTAEIAGNVAQASLGIEEVNKMAAHSTDVVGLVTANLVEVNQTTTEISKRSHAVRGATERVSAMAEQLNELVRRFKV